MPAWVGKARKGTGFGDSKCHQASQPGGLWISEKYTKTVNWKRNPMYLRSEKVNQQWSDHQRAEATPEKSAWVHYGIKILKVNLSYLQLRRQASPSTQHRQLERHWLRVTDQRKLPHLETMLKSTSDCSSSCSPGQLFPGFSTCYCYSVAK